ncbi:DNA (cytosine-5-)-methyltransferase [Clostridium gasigenes]|uniref:DNA (cytosine-5-)-methyltransferase n=1 Tax=Clostridium gasigenes TaxID=94869 RepID=UPI001C0BD009|nr:DNA (cytosine-5-)-methyltransferase [Clostridium gasigenes]MBU3131032.1 DNA (cytosine-5-)-methyltransferase [Clostridium gasigenes]
MKKTVCELFAGVGGFRLGLSKTNIDWDFVWANQWEPGKKTQHAFDCYVNHFGKNENHVNEDISIIDKKKIPNHNLLMGGFPCQDYSVAQSGAKGINGKKGVLWWEIRDIVEAKKPSFVLLENVDRLLKSPAKQRGRDFGIMLRSFNDLGYSVEWRVINAAEYGCAQKRRRVFIFAYKNKTKYAKKVNNYSLENIIYENGFFAGQFEVIRGIMSGVAVASESTYPNINEYNDLVDVSENFKYEFKNAGIMRAGKFYTVKTMPVEIKPVTLGEVLEKEVSEEYYLASNLEKWKTLKGAKKIERVSNTGHKYTYSEGTMSFPDSLEKPARTMLTSESSVNRSSHVVEDKLTKRLRLITPLEAERLNGFDDNWTNTGMPHKFRYFCMGNALVVDLVTRMGKELGEIIDSE